MDNTERKVSLNEAEFEHIFNDFADKLPKLIADLAELKDIKPANMKERQQKKNEITSIEEQIAEIRCGTNDNKKTHENNKNDLEMGSPEWRSQNAKKAADAKHNQPGGSRDKQKQIREIWETGKYTSKDRCAEEECAALDMSFSAARKALTNLPKPK